MSELASEYYEERAERLGISEVPAILGGNPVDMFEPSQTVPVYAPDLPPGSPPIRTLGSNIRSVADFLLKSSPEHADYPQDNSADPVSNPVTKPNFVKRLLIPADVNNGFVSAVQLEALARQEVPDSALHRIRQGGGESVIPGDREEDGEVYFELTGELKNGPRKLQVGGIIVARAVRAQIADQKSGVARGITTVRYGSRILSKTQAAGRRLQRETRLTSNTLKAYGMRDAFVAPNGTNRRQQGK